MKNRTLARLACLAVLVFARPGLAKPPTFPGYERASGIGGRLQKEERRLKALEAFRKYPRIKKILVSMKQGKTEFDGLDLTGTKVVREVFSRWKGIDKDEEEVSPEDLEILALLPDALKRRFPRGPGLDRDERYRTSDMLVDALMDDRLHVRRIAIKSLMRIYDSNDRLYKPDQDRRSRRARQKSWKRFIQSRRRR